MFIILLVYGLRLLREFLLLTNPRASKKHQKTHTQPIHYNSLSTRKKQEIHPVFGLKSRFVKFFNPVLRNES